MRSGHVAGRLSILSLYGLLLSSVDARHRPHRQDNDNDGNGHHEVQAASGGQFLYGNGHSHGHGQDLGQHYDDYHYNPQVYPSAPPDYCDWAPVAAMDFTDMQSDQDPCPPGYTYNGGPIPASSTNVAPTPTDGSTTASASEQPTSTSDSATPSDTAPSTSPPSTAGTPTDTPSTQSPSATPAPTSDTSTGTPTSTAPIIKQTDALPPLIRGVNLGGWLVVERWMRDSYWKEHIPDSARDEWAISLLENGADVLKGHWDTWITEDDISQIASFGLTHLRIPIGYWAFEKYPGDAATPADPFIQGQVEYLNKAIGWARTHGLKVIIDLHGVPGSQNGWDHSGKIGPILWPTHDAYIDFSVRIIDQIAGNYTSPEYKDVVEVINILNEPVQVEPGMAPAIQRFSREAYEAIRKHDPEDVWIALDTPWWDASYCCNFMLDGTRHKLLADQHIYGAVFNIEPSFVNKTIQDVLNPICGVWSDLQNNWGLPVFGGEWSMSTPQYYDFHDTPREDALRMIFDLYTQTYEKYGVGWTFWTWKVDFGGGWNYQDLASSGIIPSDPTQHKFTMAQLCPGYNGV